MRTVAKQPTAVWMDRISAITGNADGNGLKFHLDNAVAQKGSGPIVVQPGHLRPARPRLLRPRVQR